MHNKIKALALMTMLFIATFGYTQQIAFDIGTANWVGNFPGSGTYSQSISGIQVMGTADRIVVANVDPTSVFSGNDSPAVARNYSYSFPVGSTVSIDFFQLTNNSTNLPESVGNFSSAPNQSNIGAGHNLVGVDLRLEGSAIATIETVTTLTWTNVSSLSFDIASNGNVAFVGHRNLIVSGIQPESRSVPSLSNWGISFLLVAFLILFIRQHKYSHRKDL